MGKVITLSNHKGGVGKTTSTINIGAALHKQGKRVLLIDLDPQANLTQSLRLMVDDTKYTIYGAIRGTAPLKPISVAEGYDVVPSTLDLSGAEIELSSETGREYILKELLEPVRSLYDFILIDSPPSLGLLTLNALTASDEVLIRCKQST
jgi:chromosome partitioning protein